MERGSNDIGIYLISMYNMYDDTHKQVKNKSDICNVDL